MQAAAIFDLDRTLLSESSGVVLGRIMGELGLVPKNPLSQAFSQAIYGIVDRFGENLPAMALGRQAVLMAQGKPAGFFDEAARIAAGEMAQAIEPYARMIIDAHRQAGRRLVIATTTPEHLVAPLWEDLGFDDLIATRYEVGTKGQYAGKYTGLLDGHFVWSRGKARAIARWAQDNNINLSESYGYSDSFYDLPMLKLVGYPTAVNPDPRLAAYAVSRGWPTTNFDVSPGVFKVPILNTEFQRVALFLSRPQLFPYARFKVRGIRNIPTKGPVILAGNHRSYFDLPAMAVALSKVRRTGRFMAKKELTDAPIIGPMLRAGGAIPVNRSAHTGMPETEALRALAGGEAIFVMPQGTIPRGEAFFDPVLTGKQGVARMAAASGAPVIPFGLWGTEKVWPRADLLPRLRGVSSPPLVSVVFGEPVHLQGDNPESDTAALMQAISDLLPQESRTPYAPSREELRKTYPGGIIPDDWSEEANSDWG